MSPLVSVRDLSVEFTSGTQSVLAVRGVSLEVSAGQCVALVGESGSGKSTIGRSLIGLAGPTARLTAQELRVDGQDARAFGEREWRRLRGSFAGLILQDALVSLDPLRSVRREVGESLRARRPGLSRRETRDEVIRLLGDVGIPEPQVRARQHAHQLSGGLRQRALIASAIAAGPSLLIADEPTTALDVSVQRQVLALLDRLKSEGMGILLVSHDLAVVAEIADHAIVLRDGVEIESGPPADILAAPVTAYTRSLVAAIPSPDKRGKRLGGGAAPVDVVAATAPPPADAVLSARGLVVRYRKPGAARGDVITALDDVDVDVRAGRTLGIVGESGSGKSTLLRVLLAFQEPAEGRVLLDGEPWSGIPERDRRDRRMRLQIVSQDPLSSFDPRYSVRQILAEPLRHTVGTRADRHDRMVQVLRDVELGADLLDRHPLDLSGGQRQRVAIARALAAEPEILLCDEAVSALDVIVQAQVLDLLADIQHARGIAMVFVSHDLGVVHHVSDDVIVLRDGVVVERGPVDEVYDDPKDEYTRSLFASLPRAIAPGAVSAATGHPPA